MVEGFLLTAVLAAAAVTLVMASEQLRQLRRRGRKDPAWLPPVSVLKPLKGVDTELAANLETFFGLDYPTYELVFGVQDADDPALAVARRVASRHPEISCRFASGATEVGANPKVNNLAGILDLCRHQVLWISDSNVAVEPTVLSSLTACLRDPEVGLVTSLIRGRGGGGVGGALEGLHLNTFVMGGVAAVSGIFGQVCAVGKSMLFRRRDLEAIGGLDEIGRYLAEDQVLGESIRALGKRVVVSSDPVDNVLGRMTVRDFGSRFLRWARIRRHISLGGYLAELLTNPLPLALLLLGIHPVWSSVAVVGTLWIGLSLLAALAEHRLGVRRAMWAYPVLVPMRAMVVAVLWPVPFFSSNVIWRGRRFRIGYRTMLRADADWSPAELAELEPEEAAA